MYGFLSLGYDLRTAIPVNVEKVIHCGDSNFDHALYFCDHCNKFKYVPFRCKSRFCNTYGASYVSERAKNISFKLINCKHRHLVFTIPSELRRRWQATFLDLLHKKSGPSFYSLRSKLFLSFKERFYVYTKKEKCSINKNSIDYIVCYTGKPAMAQSRIINYDGSFVTFYYDRHEDGNRVTEKLSAIDFIKRLIIHIPDEQFKMVRYYSLYAKKHKHSSKFFLLLSPEKKKFCQRHSNWRARMLIAFGVDLIRCSCGHTMELLDIFIPKKSHFLDYIPPPSYNISY